MHAAHYNAVYRLTSLGPKPDDSMLRRGRSWHRVASLFVCTSLLERERELSAWKVLQVFIYQIAEYLREI